MGRVEMTPRICTRLVGLGLLAVILAALVGAGPARAEALHEFDFGETGAGAGQFSSPVGVAINQTTGDVYVVDKTANRIEQFEADGTFVRTWGRAVDQSSGGDACPRPGFPGDTCKVGAVGGAGGWFDGPTGIAVDNSGGPDGGSVYVVDAGNNRVQRFTADGDFVLMWGRNVNHDTGGDVCTATSGNTCQAGHTTGDASTVPPTPSVAGEFAAGIGGGAVDGNGFVYVADGGAVPYSRVQKFDSGGNFVAQVAPENQSLDNHGLQGAGTIAVDAAGDLYAMQDTSVKRFEAADFTATGTTAAYDVTYDHSIDNVFHGPRAIAVDPTNHFLLVVDNTDVSCQASGQPGFPPGPAGAHIFEFHPQGQPVDCTVPTAPPLGDGTQQDIAGAAMSMDHRLYVIDTAAEEIRVFQVPASTPPTIDDQRATAITTNSALIRAEVAANLANATVHVEYGASPCSTSSCLSTPESDSIGASTLPRPADRQLNDLQPDTTYYYRTVATNGKGAVEGPDRKFHTFAKPLFTPCANNLARQQTGAAFLLDCRAYELVSASDQGGYDIESNLVSGQTPYGGYPQADGKALYAVHSGGIPGAGKPTNRGPDPYVAVRNAENRRWDTSYVGVPADAPSAAPFSSTLAGADASLSAFAFAGPAICDPCFPGGSSGIPLHLPDGSLVQGMVGAPGFSVADPIPAGEVDKPLSADGSHFVFGSKQRFAAAGNDSGTDVTIYGRDLEGGTTEALSTDETGTTIAAGTNVAELDVSSNGSRTLIGEQVGTDSAGHPLYRLYMHLAGDPESIDLTPGATSGVLYDGMSAGGTIVYFSARDALLDDTDSSVDIYRADVGPVAATLTRVSALPGAPAGGTGDTNSCDPAGNSYNSEDWNVAPGEPTDCSAVAIGGGGGVASDSGAIYFLSPERLDGSKGEQDAPNLYLSRPGSAPRYVTTLESGASTALKPKVHLFQRSFGSFTNPTGVAVDPVTGSSYVLDVLKTLANPGAFVQKFDASGRVDTSFGSSGRVDGTGSLKGPFKEFGYANVPGQIAVDGYPGTVGSPNFSYRDLYVPDYANGVVDKFTPAGESVTVLAPPQPPTGVSVDPANANVYITVAANSGSNVYVYTPTGIPVKNFQVTGSPRAIAVDSSSNSYVVSGSTDSSGAFTGDVRVYDASGAFVRILDSNPSYGVAVDAADDHVYVDEGDEVVEFDPAGAQVGDPIGVGRLSDSVGVAADAGRLAVSNYGGGDALAFSPPAVPPDSSYDNPLVLDSVAEATVRHSADFQVTPSGDRAVFTSTMPLSGFDSAGHSEAFRYDAGSESIACVSCNPTDTPPSSDANLTADGLSLTDDGRVFFSSAEPLVLRDTNSKRDVYEWAQASGRAELISAGTGGFDSSLLSVSADGTDAFFFTRDTLTADDRNGTLAKLYDARAGGGFFAVPPPPQCAASDECHGPGTQAAPSPSIRTDVPGASGGNALVCKKGFVKRHGRCQRQRRHHHRRRHHVHHKHKGKGAKQARQGGKRR